MTAARRPDVQIRVVADSDDAFTVNATCNQKDPCGALDVIRVNGRYIVQWVDVWQEYRRQRIATRMYEAAAHEACRRGGRLTSTTRNPGAHSRSFWAKQARKGRATYSGDDQSYTITTCPPPPLSGVRRRRR